MYSRNQPQQDGDLAYELNVSPRASIDSITSTQKDSPAPEAAPVQEQPAPTPSIRLLFSLLPRRYVPLLLLPAVISSLIAGGIAPFMTFVVGQAFNTFASFPLSNPTQADKESLLHGVGLAALELVGLAVGSMALGSITSALWIWVGEINVAAVRRHVYARVSTKDIVWFDLNLGSGEASGDVVGAGGLMAKFSKETDDVRHGSSLALGTILQNLTTCLACLVLAFSRSYQLTFVILSAVPVLTLVQGFSQGFAGPLLQAERHSTAVAATRVERAVASIATVKAFNAQDYELSRAKEVFRALFTQARSLNFVWAISSGSAQFVMMGMFVQGFWFGAKLVREGKVEPGHVMAVFWACLIATSNLQMCIPQLIVLARGKESMSALVALAESTIAPPPPPEDLPPSPTISVRPVSLSHPRTLRKITPKKCTGELALYNVTFAYPARPTARVLSNVSLFLPAGETTYIVGGSGSGKSTIASLLVGMYTLPGTGMVAIDEQDITFLAPEFLSSHIMCLSQSSSAQLVLSGKSIAENILAALPETQLLFMTEADQHRVVRDAAQAALLHEWVNGLEMGYDTPLAGIGAESEAESSTTTAAAGVGLSGGQRQRLALARAFIRNPTILILDEATSALDPPARLLISAALRRARSNRTTVVITHDLSQIEADDFVYVMRSGRVAEGGYRGDLETVKDDVADVDGDIGEFKRMLSHQQLTGGALPVKDIPEPFRAPILVEEEEEEEEESKEVDNMENDAPQTLRPLTFGNWMFEVVADLTGMVSGNGARQGASRSRITVRQSVLPPPSGPAAVDHEASPVKHKRRPSSIHIVIPQQPTPASVRPLSRRYSMPFTPTSAATTIVASDAPWKKGYGYEYEEEDWEAVGDSDVEEFDVEKYAMQSSAAVARARTARRGRERKMWTRPADVNEVGLKMTRKERRAAKKAMQAAAAAAEQQPNTDFDEDDFARPPFWALVRAVYPTIPHKPFLFFGVLACIASGSMTPVFSFLLSRLLFEVSTGAQDAGLINRFGGLVLGIAALDGLLLGLKYFIMETSGMLWTTRLRAAALERVLGQDKKWFDRPAHAPARIMQAVVKDGDDARNLIAVVLSQGVVVATMLGVGLVWAMIRGWQLTLAGFAIAPVFAGVMALQTRLVAQCEVRNKRAREEVARGYYETIINVRGIRCMAFDPIFSSQFDAATSRALQTGVRGALVEGCTYGVASALIYLAEALLFYVGAVLIARGTYSYLQMVEVLNLVVFSVTIGAQLMAFTERIAKAVQATSDFHRLLNLDTNTDEKKGTFKPAMDGAIRFENVDFAYPAAPNVRVLKNVSLDIAPGECVAIVGASGSGKSTLAALLQRLYEPAQGAISIGGTSLSAMDITHLRTHVSVVSQSPNLFDASVADNIRYGDAASRWVDAQDVRRAAKRANVHDFIMGLPQGYATPVGENAAMISGGQAQRLQIARALARPADVLVLDECTSALDAENQAAVLETIAGLAQGAARPTTVMVTHKVQIMQMCDRIVVLQDGAAVESGTYDALVARKGVFATLASGGEWVGE